MIWLNSTCQLSNYPLLKKIEKKISFHMQSFFLFNDGRSAIIIMKNKLVYGFGDNANGELGVGNRKQSAHLQLISRLCYRNIKQIIEGGGFIVVLTLSGEVYSWGKNDFGQLGIGDTTRQIRPRYVRSKIRKIACGEQHVLALTISGNVYCWGRNHNYQLGDYYANSFASPQKNKIVQSVIDIACGVDFSIVLTEDDTHFSFWGEYIYKVPLNEKVESFHCYHNDNISTGSKQYGFLMLHYDGTIKNLYWKRGDSKFFSSKILVEEPIRHIFTNYKCHPIILVGQSNKLYVNQQLNDPREECLLEKTTKSVPDLLQQCSQFSAPNLVCWYDNLEYL